jgi:hypothetical protein
MAELAPDWDRPTGRGDLGRNFKKHPMSDQRPPRPPSQSQGSGETSGFSKPSPVVDYVTGRDVKSVFCSVCRQAVFKTRIMAGRHMCLDCIAEFYGGDED